MANSFFHPLGELHFNSYKPSDVNRALKKALAEAAENDAKIESLKSDEINFENTVEAFCAASDRLDFLSGIISHLAGTLGGEWQQKEQIVSEQATAFYTQRSLNTKLYGRLCQAQKLPKLDTLQQKLIDDLVKDYEKEGINLSPAKKTRLAELRAELSKLSIDFGQNTVKATDEAFLYVENKSDLAGIDAETLTSWADAAKQKKKPGYFIQLSPPNYDKIMTQCDSLPIRQAVHKLSRSRAPQNEKIAIKILSLRHELANLLGHKSYADYAIDQRMAKTSKKATDFIKMLTKKYDPVMQQEAKNLADFKLKNKESDLDITDVDGGTNLYFANKAFAQEIGLDSAKLQEYFPLDTVLQAMLKTLETLYGVRFTKPTNVATAHPDVEVYDVYNQDNQHISRFWCDWYARKGKQGGAWQHALYFADRSKGAYQPHLNAVCTNFAPPSKNRPSLLTIRDIETLWHEFGHAMHCAFNNTRLQAQNTYSCKWDFIEAPSQIMENWVWNEEILKLSSRHFKTGQQLDKKSISQLLSSRRYRVASAAMWTLAWSEIDLNLHSGFNQDESLTKTFRRIKQKFFAVQIPDYDISICTFTHIFAGGYAAGYYGYKWAEAIESDLFSRFSTEGLTNPEVGAEYRDKILARGDEAEPEILIKDFLKRDSLLDAMLKRDGIAK